MLDAFGFGREKTIITAPRQQFCNGHEILFFGWSVSGWCGSAAPRTAFPCSVHRSGWEAQLSVYLLSGKRVDATEIEDIPVNTIHLSEEGDFPFPTFF